MSLNPTAIYIRVSDVFPDVKDDFPTFIDILKKLSLSDTLFWCGRLNLVLSSWIDVESKVRQEFGLKQFLTQEAINTVNEYIHRMGEATKVIIFFRGQVLELLRWALLFCRDFPDDGVTFEKQEVRLNFAKAALIAGDVWGKRVFKEGRFSVGNDIDKSGQKALLGAIRKSIEATATASSIERPLGRGWTLFNDYFPSFYQDFDTKFCFKTELSIEEYYICYAAIITNFMNPTRNPGIFNINQLKENTNYGEKLVKFVQLESQTTGELKTALWPLGLHQISSFEEAPLYDYRPLREKPILSLSDGRSIILDPILFSEKATVGPLFHLLDKELTQSEANTIFSHFGETFENYSCDILKRMFPDSSSGLAKRLSCNANGYDEADTEIQIDAYLNDAVELVIFEMKAAFIPEKDVLSDNYEILIETLRKRYSVTRETTGEQKIKGVGQLAKISKAIAAKKWLGENNEFSDVKRIYPVLLVHDSLLTSPGWGSFFASEFEEHFQPESKLRNGNLIRGSLKVTPVIILSIEDLEDLETSLEHFSFSELLSAYSNSCSDRLISVRDFIANSHEFALHHNRDMAAKGQEILKKCGKIVFNEDY